jgi:hypothetical protein
MSWITGINVSSVACIRGHEKSRSYIDQQDRKLYTFGELTIDAVVGWRVSNNRILATEG